MRWSKSPIQNERFGSAETAIASFHSTWIWSPTGFKHVWDQWNSRLATKDRMCTASVRPLDPWGSSTSNLCEWNASVEYYYCSFRLSVLVLDFCFQKVLYYKRRVWTRWIVWLRTAHSMQQEVDLRSYSSLSSSGLVIHYKYTCKHWWIELIIRKIMYAGHRMR